MKIRHFVTLIPFALAPTALYAGFAPVEATPQNFIVQHDQGFARFEGKIRVAPRVSYSEGKVGVSVTLESEVLSQKNPGGLAIISWEIDLSTCASDSSIELVTLHFDGGKRTLERSAGYVDDPGGNLYAIEIRYRWLGNAKTLTFTRFEPIGDGQADEGQRPSPRALTVGAKTADELSRDAKKKLEQAKALREQEGILTGELGKIMDELKSLSAAADSAGDGRERQQVADRLGEVIERGEAKSAERAQIEAKARLLDAEAESLERQAKSAR